MDELDYAILDVLSVRPRAPWATVGHALGISAATASRRWESMRSAGLAWMSSYPGPHYSKQSRILEIHVSCAPGRRGEVAKALAEQPGLISLSSTVGDWDLVVNTQTNAGTAGVELILEDPVWSHPGIRDRRVSMALRIFSEGRDWRLGALAPAQSASLAEHHAARNESVGESTRHTIAQLLQEDPRVSASRIAAELQTSVATVSRRLETLLREGEIIVRTEVSAAASVWSTGLYVYYDVPPPLVEQVGHLVAKLPSTRLCMQVVNSRWNLSTVHWTHHLDQLHDIEAEVTARFPEVRVAARATRLREIKRVGRLLGEEQTAQRQIPIRLGD